MGLVLDVGIIFIVLALAILYFGSTLSQQHSILKWLLSGFAIIILVLGVGTEAIVIRELITTQVDSTAQQAIQSKVALGYKSLLWMFYLMIGYIVIFLLIFPIGLKMKDIAQGKFEGENEEAQELRRY